MDDINVLKDFDIFFYYGQNELEIETKSDLMSNIMQSKRSLFYNRNLDSAGIQNYENKPESLSMQIGIPYDIVNSISKRNQYVTSGENGNRDRRVAISQTTVRVEINKLGQVDITVLFIPLANFRQSETLQVGLGISNR